MKKILILYASLEGQTDKIAHYLAEEMQRRNLETAIHSMKELPDVLNLESFDGVVVGASVHMSRYPSFVVRFIKEHRQTISKVPNAFFSVCMAAYDPSDGGQQEAQQYIDRFIKKTGWAPRLTTSFAGGIRYSKYNFLIRLIMKAIAKQKQLPTDTSNDYEYTDWGQVTHFAEEFITRYVRTH